MPPMAVQVDKKLKVPGSKAAARARSLTLAPQQYPYTAAQAHKPPHRILFTSGAYQRQDTSTKL